MSDLPAWAAWSEGPAFTIGVEEEVMLLEPDAWTLAGAIDEVLPRLPAGMRASSETHASALEVATAVHHRVGDAVEELRALRAQLRETCAACALSVAAAGTHPFAVWRDVAVTEGARHAAVHGSMRELARREPTFALHVHVGVPDPEDAVRVANRMRVHSPVLLALSANSPFWQGRDTGLASARTPLFQAFPRVGLPRAFRDYRHWAGVVDLLLRTEALPEPTFLWWDVRLQPPLGTVELRITDVQATPEAAAALVALAQSLVRLEALEGHASDAAIGADEALAENRFLAARDGVEAALVDVDAERRVPLAESLPALLDACRPHAEDLGCAAELDGVAELVAEPWARRQVELARGPERLRGLVAALAGAY